MATGSLSLKLLNSELGRTGFCCLETPNRMHSLTKVKGQGNGSILPSHRSHKMLTVSCVESLVTAESIKSADEGENTNFPAIASQLAPSSDEVESLLTGLCDTSIAELELKLHGFHLHVTRKLTRKAEAPAIISSGSTVKNTVVEQASSNGSVSTTPFAIRNSAASEGSNEKLLDKAADEGLVIINSPRVGFFRRSRTMKEKRAPPPCKEKQIVEEGQVLCYIEQLGGELAVEVQSNVSGEVVKFLHEDGEPVGYGDPIVAILPSFHEILKLPPSF
ncbi:Biotin carboxyl carrier protein of acetyl-CoA carboxylase-like protein [Drosera capensis]